MRDHKILYVLCLVLLCLIFNPEIWGQTRGVESGERYGRLVIRNVILIDGKGTPPRGPVDIILRENRIESVRGARQGEDAYTDERGHEY